MSKQKEKTIYEALDHIISLKSVVNPELHLMSDAVGQLVKQEELNFIILNLYNLSDGFELFAKAKTKMFLCKMSYEEGNRGKFPVLAPCIDERGIPPPESSLWIRHSNMHLIQHSSFLNEIDRGEAPLKLLMMLKDLEDKFMYDKYIIIRINDFITEASNDFSQKQATITKAQTMMKRNISPFFSFFSLLKPSYETLKFISGVEQPREMEAEQPREMETEQPREIEAEQPREIEAKLLVEFSEPLCLDPTPVSLSEQFKMKKNSLSNPKFQDILQNKWQSTLAEAKCTDDDPLSGFTGYLKSKQEIEDIVNEKHDLKDLWNKLPELCNQSYSKITTMPPTPTFEEFLKKRIVKSLVRPTYKFPVLLEEFGFECIKVNEDGNKETIKRTFFSVFETKKGSLYAKVHYTTPNKIKKAKVNCYEVPIASQLNTHLVRHAKLITSGECSNYLKVIHKVPNGAAYVAFDNTPFHPAQIKNEKDYREDPNTDSEQNSKDNDSGVNIEPSSTSQKK